MDRKNNFSETRKYSPRVGKNFRKAGKILEKREKFDFVLAKHAVSQGTKVMVKISVRKLILCELLRLHFKRKNNNINGTCREKLVLY